MVSFEDMFEKHRDNQYSVTAELDIGCNSGCQEVVQKLVSDIVKGYTRFMIEMSITKTNKITDVHLEEITTLGHSSRCRCENCLNF